MTGIVNICCQQQVTNGVINHNLANFMTKKFHHFLQGSEISKNNEKYSLKLDLNSNEYSNIRFSPNCNVEKPAINNPRQ